MFGHRKKAANDHAELSVVAEHLAKSSFFEGFTQDELVRVASLADEVVAEKGAVLIDQGRVGLECFVILEGSSGVYVSGEHVATNGPGSMIGEMALVEHRPRNATVIAETPMTLIAFDTRAFRTLLQEMPKAHDRVMEILASRLKVNLSTQTEAHAEAVAESGSEGEHDSLGSAATADADRGE